MIRLFLMGFVAVVVLIVAVVTLFFVFSVLGALKRIIQSGKAFFVEQYQQWQQNRYEKEEAKDMPGFLHQADLLVKQLAELTRQLDSKWRFRLEPMVAEAKELIQKGKANPRQAESIRTFYVVTVKTLHRFVQALLDMQNAMQQNEEEKARQNIEILQTDIYKYRARLDSKKRFDFHVMMDVIKHRLGK